ncbi:uncharacterized protein NECHADRAFT_75702 [Fusarium vanettenii 77-13-4]|uniref:ribonuclease H n=1 Tax=Fusarium vanettenii (strain ATCC MYA-4622 / CBS 123669 / FGSC 9596 / NRRL 45880 / 77-13-4) TaxID=660122 RepID=C7YJJ7_FUSV7|nr:uncharacterized protein NECHADRAFT_75702 [Fusarium vanettenii 77-13-4]EEU48989.1 hypothetical protein NECHADRAFT_75702 [Fusarium vanettenii 77-13-4]
MQPSFIPLAWRAKTVGLQHLHVSQNGSQRINGRPPASTTPTIGQMVSRQPKMVQVQIQLMPLRHSHLGHSPFSSLHLGIFQLRFTPTTQLNSQYKVTSTRMKFYAVAVGRITGVFTTWDETKPQVNGYSGAIHKSFKSREKAQEFLYQHKDESNPFLRPRMEEEST